MARVFGGWCFRYEPHRPDQLDHGGNLRGCAAVEADVGRSRANPAFEANTDAGSVVALRISALLEAAGLAWMRTRFHWFTLHPVGLAFQQSLGREFGNLL